MKTIDKIDQLRSELRYHRHQQKSIGFVPTMGALHQGHLDLIDKGRQQNDILVCSIFVNPVQFNNKEDLNNYPRALAKDLEMLKKAGCDYAFTPSVSEMYPEPVTEKYNFGHLEQVMEGKFRPGHFNGVAVVVRKLLEITEPKRAYFGEKDYQQLQIIRKLVQEANLNVKIVPVEISREVDGLARSSRNARLKPEEREAAPAIYKIISKARDKLQQFQTPADMQKWGLNELKKQALLEPEYFEIVDMETLAPVSNWDETSCCILCVAVFIGEVRLIDNIILFS